MKSSGSFWITISISMIVCIAMFGCIAQEKPLELSADEFELTLDSLPDEWNIEREIRDGVDKLALEQLQQLWAAGDPGYGHFQVVVRRYQAVEQAEDGYRLALRRLRESRYSTQPRPEWEYKSPRADEYEVVCSPPQTMGKGCVAVGRYVNYVTLASLEPGDGLLLSSAPDLFEDIDQQVQNVIKAHQARETELEEGPAQAD